MHYKTTKIKSPNDWVHDIHQYAKSKGWWDQERNALEVIALIMSELGEAVEEFRNPNIDIDDLLWNDGMTHSNDSNPKFKPEGPSVELVDAVIRIFDYFGFMGWDFERVLSAKHRYNQTRPYRHNKRY